MLSTPKNHLPKGYPLPSPEESLIYEPIFDRAFEIHRRAHDFNRHEFSAGSLNPVGGPGLGANYCDCYERAYRELLQPYLKPLMLRRAAKRCCDKSRQQPIEIQLPEFLRGKRAITVRD